MASLLRISRPRGSTCLLIQSSHCIPSSIPRQCHRSLQTSTQPYRKVPDFAFAFDIDGVLLRSSSPLPRAHRALSYLQSKTIPFILLTNGGGKPEAERVQELSERLQIPLNTDMFVQSHTPFQELVNEGENGEAGYRDKHILVTGSDGDKCRKVAENYGFKNVLTPADILTTHPQIWPFASPQSYISSSRPLPTPSLSPKDYTPTSTPTPLKIDSIFIYNDPRDWALDTQLILDLLLSHSGYLGSLSPKNGNPALPNRGYQQDSQPPLYFSNPDLHWSSSYHLPRLGQGGFQAAFTGVWNAVTGGPANGVELKYNMIGKPSQATFQFAEKRLQSHRKVLLGKHTTRIGLEGLKRVYMVGDNPESDVRGANEFRSESGVGWESVLVRSGVYGGGEPRWRPKVVVGDVWDAVRWGIGREGVEVEVGE